jgi:hypothetical protein
MDVDELLQDHAIRSEVARMKLHDLARRSDEARIRSAGENADMERTYKGVMEILEPHIGQEEIREIIFTLTMYQKPCPSWYPCPHWWVCGGFKHLRGDSPESSTKVVEAYTFAGERQFGTGQ